MEPFFTVGHSTRPIDEFISLLQPTGVTRIVDVRSFPRSRTNPQYNVDVLPHTLRVHGIGYEHVKALGGKRPRQKDVPEDLNAFWDVEGFRNYADYALGDEFRAGFEHLLETGDRERVAVMCAEAVWWQCHRMLLSDALVAREIDVEHILSAVSVQPHRLTPFAQIQAGGHVRYPGLI